MIILALDTCDRRGSVALLRDDELLKAIAHEEATEYSTWLLPSVEEALNASGLGMREVEVYAVASGPGSFTGVRMGMTTVKAWAEVYGKKIASVSRLEAIATQAIGGNEFVAAFFDARRDQVYGGLFRRKGAELGLVEEEMVVGAPEFLSWVGKRVANERVSWVSMDAEMMTTHDLWQARAEAGERVEASGSVLAPTIGRIGWHSATEGRLTDVLKLDAQYLRRPDAEVYWKGGTKRGS